MTRALVSATLPSAAFLTSRSSRLPKNAESGKKQTATDPGCLVTPSGANRA